ncbi:hypothetical protein BJN44_11045 [Tessaracoccus sp. ZS01]|nr:hypothetical protein BJN44_11045 [Tessaracoccus sp. ZS01]
MPDKDLTRPQQFAETLLHTLHRKGPLTREEAIVRVGEQLDGTLTDAERQRLTAARHSERWTKVLLLVARQLEREGLISDGITTWSLTEKGDASFDATGGDAPDVPWHLAAEAGSSSDVIDAAMTMVGPGEWTTFRELGALAGVRGNIVGRWAWEHCTSSVHRLLGDAGRTLNQTGFGERTQQEILQEEGVDFEATGLAREEYHLRLEDLRELLETSGVLLGLPRRAWLVRGSSVDGHDLIPTWLRDGFASLRAAKLREVDGGISRAELKEIVDEDYSQTSYAAKAAKLDEFHAFLSRMRAGDIVASTSQGKLYVGTVSGPAEYVASPSGLSNLRRDVDWSPVGHDYGDLAPEIKARLQIQYDVVEMTQQLDLLDEMLAPPSAVDESPAPVGRELVLPDASDELAEQLHVDRAWLQECVDLLRDRPQLIFYGPPGTGKTFIAQHLAAHLAGDNVRLVQFHPAYSYEDFFEGYRPLEEGGFKLKPGPLRKVVDAARDNPSTPYFLLIDEINRGNLAKIFGELYFLLEYRNQNVDLLYATDDDIGFTLPENVFIIGTMNTADRSIALVDAAMRRRFAFVPLHPSEAPTRDVLRRWLAATGRDGGVADLLDELNRRIEDPDFRIGPSYFMRDAVHADGGLERAWRTAILPLLEEHHYGDGMDVRQQYGLEAIRARVAKQSDDAVTSDGDQPADPA